uniref:Uncharacterized protein n=1 Tax=Pithovirus LCPAC406 TaxID=2506599 RepID=A0A481ZHH7_9VIRU|nr:MAG: uncharacterized protein LCPAC406_03630 [Pithovirus LCPAC406]
MTRLVCINNEYPLDGMNYELPKDARIFLDKINSPLVSKSGKECHWYKDALSQYRNPKIGMYREYAYNEEGEYFIHDAGIRGIKWRTHPDLIAYIEQTDQTNYKIMDVPEGKIFTEFHLEESDHNDLFIIIISDSPISFA